MSDMNNKDDKITNENSSGEKNVTEKSGSKEDNKEKTEENIKNKRSNIVIDNENKKRIYKISKRKSFAAGITFICIILLCITVTLGIFIKHIIDKNEIYDDLDHDATPSSSEEKIEYKKDTNEWYEDYIKNLVMLDFADFEKADDIPNDMLLRFGIWQVLTNSDVEYTANSKGEINLPARDVEAFIKLHFNVTNKIEHHSVTDGNIRYKSSSKTYAVPSYGYDDCYVPKITKNTKNKNDTITLELDYYNSLEYYNKMNISTSETAIKENNIQMPSSITTAESSVDVKPKKHVILTLSPNGKQFRFDSLKTTSVTDETPDINN